MQFPKSQSSAKHTTQEVQAGRRHSNLYEDGDESDALLDDRVRDEKRLIFLEVSCLQRPRENEMIGDLASNRLAAAY